MEDAREESPRDIPVEGRKVTLVVQGDVGAHGEGGEES
jgi:hypothetical protein